MLQQGQVLELTTCGRDNGVVVGCRCRVGGRGSRRIHQSASLRSGTRALARLRRDRHVSTASAAYEEVILRRLGVASQERASRAARVAATAEFAAQGVAAARVDRIAAAARVGACRGPSGAPRPALALLRVPNQGPLELLVGDRQ